MCWCLCVPENLCRLVEVKSTTDLKEHQTEDVAIQSYVVSHTGVNRVQFGTRQSRLCVLIQSQLGRSLPRLTAFHEALTADQVRRCLNRMVLRFDSGDIFAKELMPCWRIRIKPRETIVLTMS